jgi:hypothetical protein
VENGDDAGKCSTKQCNECDRGDIIGGFLLVGTAAMNCLLIEGTVAAAAAAPDGVRVIDVPSRLPLNVMLSLGNGIEAPKASVRVAGSYETVSVYHC